MQDIVRFTLGIHACAFLINQVGKVMTKSVTIDSYCYMNTERAEINGSGTLGLSLASVKGLVGFLQLKKSEMRQDVLSLTMG